MLSDLIDVQLQVTGESKSVAAVTCQTGDARKVFPEIPGRNRQLIDDYDYELDNILLSKFRSPLNADIKFHSLRIYKSRARLDVYSKSKGRVVPIALRCQ